MEETWLPIAGHKGYEVSARGRVRSIDRVLAKDYGGRIVRARLKGRVLQPRPVGKGYLAVKLSRARSTACVHRLVLEAFVGSCPAGHQAAHHDGDRRNNSLGNLRWATARENREDVRRHGRLPVGARHHLGARTHCKNGHRWDAVNTGRQAKGRRCLACHRAETAARRRAAGAAVIAAAQAKGAGITPAPGRIY